MRLLRYFSLYLLAFSLVTGASAYTWLTYDYSQTVISNSTTRYVRIAWPDDYPYVRGIFVHAAASSGDTRASYTSPEFQEFLRFHQLAFIGTKGWEFLPGAAEQASVFTNGLASFVTQSGHAEIANCPFIFFGHSGGGSAEYSLVKTNVSKSIAWVSASGGTGTVQGPPEIWPIPALTWSGSSDVANLEDQMQTFMGTNRPAGMLGAFTEFGGADHTASGDSPTARATAMGFLNEMLLLGYPANQCPLNGPLTLSRLAESSGWLVDTNTIRTVFCTLTNYAAYAGTKATAFWLPNQNAAYLYRAFSSHSPPIVLSSPTDLQQFNAGQNITVTVDVSSYAGWTNMALFSFATNIANFTGGTPSWTITNVSAGLYVFSAIATRGGSNVVTRPLMVSVIQTAAPDYSCYGNFYAATNGLSTNSGTIVSPWDLRTALHKTSTILPGNTLYLRGGAYTNAPEGYVTNSNEGHIFEATISGAYTNPITIQSYPGEWAVMDGQAFGGIYSFHANARPTLMVGSSSDATKGRFLTWKNFEITSSSTETRTAPDDDSFPAAISRSDGTYFFGVSNQVINVIVHDCTTGFSAWEQSSAILLHGCLSYNNGWLGTPHAHGHGMYTQNKTARENKVVGTNIFINNCDNAIQAYGSGSAEVFHYRILGNLLVNNRLLVGGRVNAVQGDNQIRDNLQYNSDLVFIYFTSTNATDIQVANNYVGLGGLQGGSWTNAVITNNTVIQPGSGKLFDLLPISGSTVPTGWTVDYNHYQADTDHSFFGVEATGVAPKSFSQWKSFTAWETNSTLTSTLPTTNLYVLQTNSFDTNRAHLAIYNWAVSNAVAFSLSSLGWSGSDSVRVRNAQDYFVDVTTNTIPGIVLTLNMQAAAHTVALPNGSQTAFGPKTFPQFGAFVIERMVGAASTPTNTISIASSTPSSGISITATTDLNGNSTGTTAFNRQYLFGTPINLTAPATSLVTNNFSKWTRNGVDYSFAASITYTVDTNVTLTAVYVAPPVVTWTLNISSSNPNSGVVITNTPADNTPRTQGTTPFSLIFNDGVTVVLDAPTTSGGNNFQRWDKNGSSFTVKPSITFTANSATLLASPATFAAVYSPPTPSTNALAVTSFNPGSAVAITNSLADVNGLQNGATPFTRVYGIAANVTLTAPYTAQNGNVWIGWADEDGFIGSTNLTSQFFMNVSRGRMAVYTNAPLPGPSLLKGAKNRRRGLP